MLLMVIGLSLFLSACSGYNEYNYNVLKRQVGSVDSNNGKEQPVPVSDDGKEQPVPVGDDGKEQPVPVSDDEKKQPVLASNNGIKQPVHVSDDGKEQPVPVGDDGKEQPVPVGDDGKEQPVPVGDDGKEQPVPVSDKTIVDDHHSNDAPDTNETDDDLVDDKTIDQTNDKTNDHTSNNIPSSDEDKGNTPDGHTPDEDKGNTPDGDKGNTPDGDKGNTPDGDKGATPDEDKGNTPDGDKGNTPDGDKGNTPDDHTPDDSNSMAKNENKNESVTTQPVSDDSTSSTDPPATHPSSCNEDSINPTAPPEESDETIAAISIFFILVLLGISVVMVHLFIKFKFHYLPESIGFVTIGVLIGAIFLLVKTTTGYDYQYQEKLSPQFFFLVLLPPIIFESGYSLHKGNFFQNLGSIIMFAVFGTAISAVIVGGGIYGLGVMGVIYKLDVIESFTFGSLISAVDPVATIAIFHALDVDPTLNMLVFGESVLNDAVSIVLTKAILNQIPSSTNSNDSIASVLGNSAWQFIITFFGSAVLGVMSALFSAAFLKYINLRRHQSLEFAMWVIFAFGPYFLAEGMHLSGIMAVLFCGIVMSHYTHFNLSPVTQVTVQQALRTVSFMAETGVFLYLGLAMFSIHKSFDIALIIWSLVLILIGRAANIFPITGLMNQCRSVKISLRMQCIMWYSGLRGAVAFALAQNLQEYFSKEVTGYLVTTTLVIVLFTIVILGGSTLPLLKFLKADKGAKLTLSKTEEQDNTVTSGHIIERGISKINLKSFGGWSKAFLYFEFRYIRPLFMLTFSREEVKTARFEMQQKTVEWYQGLREASLSEEETTDMSTSTTGSTLLHSPI